MSAAVMGFELQESALPIQRTKDASSLEEERMEFNGAKKIHLSAVECLTCVVIVGVYAPREEGEDIWGMQRDCSGAVPR